MNIYVYIHIYLYTCINIKVPIIFHACVQTYTCIHIYIFTVIYNVIKELTLVVFIRRTDVVLDQCYLGKQGDLTARFTHEFPSSAPDDCAV